LPDLAIARYGHVIKQAITATRRLRSCAPPLVRPTHQPRCAQQRRMNTPRHATYGGVSVCAGCPSGRRCMRYTELGRARSRGDVSPQVMMTCTTRLPTIYGRSVVMTTCHIWKVSRRGPLRITPCHSPTTDAHASASTHRETLRVYPDFIVLAAVQPAVHGPPPPRGRRRGRGGALAAENAAAKSHLGRRGFCSGIAPVNQVAGARSGAQLPQHTANKPTRPLRGQPNVSSVLHTDRLPWWQAGSAWRVALHHM
jgi:hypothetical protein